MTTAVTLVLAFVVAFGLERTGMPGRRFVAGALALPMLAPSLVLGLGLIFYWGATASWARCWAYGPKSMVFGAC